MSSPTNQVQYSNPTSQTHKVSNKQKATNKSHIPNTPSNTSKPTSPTNLDFDGNCGTPRYKVLTKSTVAAYRVAIQSPSGAVPVSEPTQFQGLGLRMPPRNPASAKGRPGGTGFWRTRISYLAQFESCGSTIPRLIFLELKARLKPDS